MAYGHRSSKLSYIPKMTRCNRKGFQIRYSIRLSCLAAFVARLTYSLFYCVLSFSIICGIFYTEKRYNGLLTPKSEDFKRGPPVLPETRLVGIEPTIQESKSCALPLGHSPLPAFAG